MFQKSNKIYIFGPNPAIRGKFSFRNLFFNGFAGTSFGRSTKPEKNSFQNFKAFHCYLGQKKFKELKI